MRVIDTHAHLYDEAFREDIAEVVIRAKGQGVEKIFLPNIDEASWPEMLRLCAGGKGFFYPMCGLHPTEVRADYAEVLDRMETKRNDAPFIGIGEVGLDFYWDRTYEQAQKEAFVRQVEWAVAWRLPLMIHSRSAQGELVDLLSPYRSKGITGVFHCFGGNRSPASVFYKSYLTVFEVALGKLPYKAVGGRENRTVICCTCQYKSIVFKSIRHCFVNIICCKIEKHCFCSGLFKLSFNELSRFESVSVDGCTANTDSFLFRSV